MNKISIVALCWLTLLSGFIAGLVVVDSKVWPYYQLLLFKKSILANTTDGTSLLGKIANDLNVKPSRHIKTVSMKLQNPSEYESLQGLQLNSRRDRPLLYMAKDALEGYRVIVGIFDFEEGLHGVVLLDPQGEVVHTWQLSQQDVKWSHEPDTNVIPHGFEIAPDGSIVIAYDSGTSLTKYDYCGNLVWQIEGLYHHSIALEGNDAIWSWNDLSLTKINYNNGEILKTIDLNKVMEVNSDIDIFGIRQIDTAESSTWVNDGDGYWHPNDIDPLPKELAPYYPQFKTGDLLVSLRNPDLVFVMDQETYKVKWWRQGLTRRQHDPDWNKKGTITIFDNNMHRGFSRIREIDPKTYEHSTMLDGSLYNFYTWCRGTHQVLPNGGIQITSSEQGRVFETDRDGKITFEFINKYGEGEALSISEARFIPVNQFKGLQQCD